MASWHCWDDKAESPDLLINVLLQPKSRKNEIIGVHGDSLKVRITAPPVDGKANQQLCAFFAKVCEVKSAMVTLESGQTSRIKRLRIQLPTNTMPTGLHNY